LLLQGELEGMKKKKREKREKREKNFKRKIER
jgi:hypothetical protein